MSKQGQPMEVDQVQIFGVEEVLEGERSEPRVDLAKSPRSDIAVFVVPPEGGAAPVEQYPDSDQILMVLRGEGTIDGPAGPSTLSPHKGVMVPAGASYGIANTGSADLVLLSLRNEATSGPRPGWVPNDPSGVVVRIPEESILGKGVGRNVFVYAMDRKTIGVSPIMTEEWNKGCLVRMNCTYTREGGYLIANLPERLVAWYGLDRLDDSDYQVVPNADHTMVRIDLSPLINREGRSE